MEGIVPKEILERKSKANIGAFAEKEILNHDYAQVIGDLKEDKYLQKIINISYFEENIVKSMRMGDFYKGNNLLRAYLVISLVNWKKSLEKSTNDYKMNGPLKKSRKEI